MIYSSLDSSHQDESNDSKIIQIGAIFVKIAIFQKFRVGSGRVNCITRPDISGRVGSGTRISGQKCGALLDVHVVQPGYYYKIVANKVPHTNTNKSVHIQYVNH